MAWRMLCSWPSSHLDAATSYSSTHIGLHEMAHALHENDTWKAKMTNRFVVVKVIACLGGAQRFGHPPINTASRWALMTAQLRAACSCA
mmetsp:Transcript_70502/g.117058  ORF Transcript_70502/g.117058 Transcript_70502/m.117058 type:complete len:89 (-) Transcript_70502:1243-1509(-)